MIKTIAVIGAGTMGHGIAAVFAMHGYPVHLCETYAVDMLKTVMASTLVPMTLAVRFNASWNT